MLKSSYPHAGNRGHEEPPVSDNNSNGNNKEVDMDREVIRCKSCGLVQYRTNSGNCRRCLRMLPPKVEFLIPPPGSSCVTGGGIRNFTFGGSMRRQRREISEFVRDLTTPQLF